MAWARKLDPGPGTRDNLYAHSSEELKEMGIGILPQTLHEAVDALEQDSILCDALGQGVTREFINLKRAEWVEYQRHVSDWEIQRYVEFF